MRGGYETIYRHVDQGKKFTRLFEVTSTRDKGLILVSRSSPIGSKSAMDEKVSVIDIPPEEKLKLIEALTKGLRPLLRRKSMTTNTAENVERTIEIRTGVSIEWMLSLPNMMDYLTFSEDLTEQEARAYLQSLIDDGHDIWPLKKG